jgi:hypothetical protein
MKDCQEPALLESLRRARKFSEGRRLSDSDIPRAKAPRTPSSECFSFAAFASLREIIAPHNTVHPETRIMGRGHGTYDEIILLNEVSDYEARVDKASTKG